MFSLTVLLCAGQIAAQQVFSGSNSIPQVSLLIDLPGYNSTTSIRSLVEAVSVKKGKTFNFGVAYDAGSNATEDMFAVAKLQDTFNHGVAENNCKWQFTEPQRGQFDLTPCKNSRDFFLNHSSNFRLHNTFWHQQLGAYLPGNFSASELLTDIIPSHVRGEISGIGNTFVSVDVMNEIVGDSTNMSMTAFECIADKMVWPTTRSDTDMTPLLQNMTFVEVAMTAARNASGGNGKLLLNDYSTGGNNSKTACYYKIAQYLQARQIPLDGIGFQSHVGAKASNFDSKTAVKATFAEFAALGLESSITEFDVWLQDNSYESHRWQAAIYGDYLDACLYSDNCNEFIIWGLYDAVSWLNTFPGRGVSAPLLFDNSTMPKTNYFEVRARLERFLSGAGEPCATAAGSSVCNVTTFTYTAYSNSTSQNSSRISTTASQGSASSAPSSTGLKPLSSGAAVTASTSDAYKHSIPQMVLSLTLLAVAGFTV